MEWDISERESASVEDRIVQDKRRWIQKADTTTRRHLKARQRNLLPGVQLSQHEPAADGRFIHTT